MLNLAEFLFENRGANTDPRWLADVLGRLVWLTEDNGRAIHQTLESWLTSGNLEQVKVALAYDEALLFQSRAEAEQIYAAVSARFPDINEACTTALALWAHVPVCA